MSLHCDRIDVSEAHYAQITVLCLSGILGTEFWTTIFPGSGLEMKVRIQCAIDDSCHGYSVAGTVGVRNAGLQCVQSSSCSLYSAHQGCWKEWLYSGCECCTHTCTLPLSVSLSLLQDTSVLSPMISPVVVAATLLYHTLYSPAHSAHSHYILFFLAFGLQVTKITLLMMVCVYSECCLTRPDNVFCSWLP